MVLASDSPRDESDSGRQRAVTVWPLGQGGRVVWGGASASSGGTSPGASVAHCVTNGTRRAPARPRLGHSAHGAPTHSGLS